MGAGVSKAKTETDNAVKSSIKSLMDNEVKASVNVECRNEQIVNGANRCNIQFADQMCNAIGTSNFAGSTTFSAESAQTIMNQLTSKTDAMTSGLVLGYSKSDSHSTTKNLVEMAVDVTQKFHTDCTRDVRAINIQSVTNCSESAIKFNPQSITAEVIGDCVADASGDFKAVQNLTNIVDISTTSTTKGVDIFGVVFLYLLFIFGVPMFVAGMKKAVFTPTANLTTVERQANKQRFVMIMVIMTVITLSMLIWWPGIIAAKLKVWPYSYPTVDAEYDPANPGNGVPMCQDGKNLNRATFVNEFMWYDPLCLSTPDEPCTSTTKQKHYEGCGVFATRSGCDDPEHTKDKASFAAILDACSALTVSNAKPQSCEVADVAYETLSTAAEYGSCLQCTDPLSGRVGYWVREGGFCSMNNVHERAYLKQPGTLCQSGDSDCRSSEEELLRDSPDDCMDLLYQNDKKKLSHILGVCDKIQSASSRTRDPETGLLPDLKYQCPPKAVDYMTKCSDSSGKCTYTAVSDDPYVIASCANSLDDCCTKDENGILKCNDSKLEIDMDIYNHWNNVCYDRWAKASKLSVAAMVTLGVYVLLFGIMIFLIMRVQSGQGGGPVGSMTSGGGPVVNTPQDIGTRVKICVFFFVLFWFFGAPLGLLGYVNGTKDGKISINSVYKRDTSKKDFDEDGTRLLAIIGMSISGAISFFLFLSVIYMKFSSTSPGITTQNSPSTVSNPVMET